MNEQELIALPAVKRFTGMGKTFLYSPRFSPRPVKVGRSTRWLKSEVLGWVDEQPRAELARDRKVT